MEVFMDITHLDLYNNVILYGNQESIENKISVNS